MDVGPVGDAALHAGRTSGRGGKASRPALLANPPAFNRLIFGFMPETPGEPNEPATVIVIKKEHGERPAGRSPCEFMNRW